MDTSFLKITEIDVIWALIYLAMVVGLAVVILVLYGTYQEFKNKE